MEGLSFLEALLTGMTVCCAYACLCLLRRAVRHTPAAIAAEDLLFWPGAAVYVFVQIHHTTNGSIRWYFILGVVLGSAFFSFVSKFRKNCLKNYTGSGREIRQKLLKKEEKKAMIKNNNQPQLADG